MYMIHILHSSAVVSLLTVHCVSQVCARVSSHPHRPTTRSALFAPSFVLRPRQPPVALAACTLEGHRLDQN